ncbi:HU family DNA-binding protein [Ferrimonas marina]|uniref:Integration host factor subunit beta n=1 Tax=Ferrimonas marina TaxID=299255 RepID=A0A1M5TAZ3_9GAMM|nr:HU family DNA-binding protein [Ferrimonas marina]SHH47902.1 integration host factor subunit beta [Ferrimonas marina]
MTDYILRSELCREIHNDLELEELGFSQAEVATLVDSFLGCIQQTVSDGGRVELRGFGCFEGKMSRPKMGRNPKTGDPVAVDAKIRIRFKAAKGLAEAVNKSAPVRDRPGLAQAQARHMNRSAATAA